MLPIGVSEWDDVVYIAVNKHTAKLSHTLEKSKCRAKRISPSIVGGEVVTS